MNEYKKEVEKSVDVFVKFTQSQIEEMDKSNDEEGKGISFINDYPRFNCNDAIKLCKNSRDKPEKELCILNSFYKPNLLNKHRNNQAIIYEYWFNCYSKFWFKDSEVEKNNKGLEFKIKRDIHQ